MEHFRVMTKLRMLSTLVCLAAICSGQRRPITLRFQLALLGRFRIRAVSESTAPLRVCLFDSSAAVNVSQSCGALRACILGTFSHTTCYPISFASWTGQQKVCIAYLQNYTEDSMEHFRVTKLSGQRQPITCVPLGLGSWDVFAYGLLPNRLSSLGQASRSSPRRISTGRLHALRRFHSPPINLIVFEAPYRITP